MDLCGILPYKRMCPHLCGRIISVYPRNKKGHGNFIKKGHFKRALSNQKGHSKRALSGEKGHNTGLEIFVWTYLSCGASGLNFSLVLTPVELVLKSGILKETKHIIQ